jgi:serine/threonine-protein kinase ATR
MAKAAFESKAYARALMNYEQLILTKQHRGSGEEQLQPYYERLHQIYAQLDEPDGMEGISTLVLSPSLEHQIREHESFGRWTSSQSCWEIKLQHSPEDIDLHIGLLRCLQNLGHYGAELENSLGVALMYSL